MIKLPFHLEKLPFEAHTLLQYMLHQAKQTTEQMEQSGLSQRSVGKALRRLVNADYLDRDGAMYELTTDGKVAARQLQGFYIAQSDGYQPDHDKGSQATRRLVVVSPRTFVAEKPEDLYVGVNPPGADEPQLPFGAQIELRVSAIGGVVGVQQFSVDVPGDKAAVPKRIRVLPESKTALVAVRIEAFQAIALDEYEPLGGINLEVPVYVDAQKQDKTPRAVGMDVTLKGERA